MALNPIEFAHEVNDQFLKYQLTAFPLSPPWQLEQIIEDPCAECEIHARNILGEEGFKKLQAELAGETTSSDTKNTDGPFVKKDLFSPAQGGLF